MKPTARPAALLAALLLAASVPSAGCDEPAPRLGDAAPAPVEATGEPGDADPPAVPERPTTRELLDGPTRRVSFAPVPLALTVPESWSLEAEAVDGREVRYLAGAAPAAGDVQVAVNQRPDATADDVDALIARAERRAADPAPGTPPEDAAVAAAEVRGLGAARVLEERLIERPLTPAPGDPPPELRWTVNVFVPVGDAVGAVDAVDGAGGFRWYTLNVLGVTPAEYRADEAFLRRIVDSLTFDAPPAPQP